jgi:hypothetical protein
LFVKHLGEIIRESIVMLSATKHLDPADEILSEAKDDKWRSRMIIEKAIGLKTVKSYARLMLLEDVEQHFYSLASTPTENLHHIGTCALNNDQATPHPCPRVAIKATQ